jgi:hypothetical protein
LTQFEKVEIGAEPESGPEFIVPGHAQQFTLADIFCPKMNVIGMFRGKLGFRNSGLPVVVREFP